MKKYIVLIILLSIFMSSCSGKAKYEAQCNQYLFDYMKLYVEIVKPSLEIEDNDEFLDYYASDEIVKKINEAEIIDNKINDIEFEHKLWPSGYRNSIITLKELTKAKEYMEDKDDAEKDDVINGLFGYKYTLKRHSENYEQNIELQYKR